MDKLFTFLKEQTERIQQLKYDSVKQQLKLEGALECMQLIYTWAQDEQNNKSATPSQENETVGNSDTDEA